LNQQENPMRAFFGKLINDKSGVTAVEYGLIAALIAVAAVSIMGMAGTSSKGHSTLVPQCLVISIACPFSDRPTRSSSGRSSMRVGDVRRANSEPIAGAGASVGQLGTKGNNEPG
jgi:pilus assembly protein Flp/PilA